MAINKYSPDVDSSLQPSNLQIEPNPKEMTVDLEAELDDELLTQLDDGSMEIMMSDQESFGDTMASDFNANLAEVVPEDAMRLMATDLVTLFDADKEARKDWESAVAEGLKLLGVKTEARTEPWPGASGVYHPVLAETAIQFQAHAIMELFPASGPARTVVYGEETEELLQKAVRVEQEINFQITQKMSEYRFETEQLLYRLALCGSGFKKVYLDPTLGRPVSMYVPAEDIVVPYGASDLESCERCVHVMKRSQNQLKKLMKTGFYKEVKLELPPPKYSQVREKTDKLVGETPSMEVDDRHDILEMHVEVDFSEYGWKDPFAEEGVACPYVVTIEHSSKVVLSIRRNWSEDDQHRIKNQHFVHYQYLPGLGFYGTGLFHIIGGLAKSATSLLRQLIDNGTLSNLPAGFKARGMRVKDDGTPLRPGEFRDVDVPGNSIRDGVLPLPIKEPSPVLLSLLQNVVDEARRVGSVPDMDISDLQEGLPVGTTLAVLERSLKVMSAVQARMHAALRLELGMIANIISQLPGNYEYGVEGEYDRAEDFADRIRIVPVSDPNATTTAQRVIQYQTVLQLASQQPSLYDMPRLHRTMLDYIGVKDAAKLVKMPDEFTPMDPVGENMAILTSKPVKAFLYQDHKAHIAVHMAAAQDPTIIQMVQQAPNATAIMAAMSAHVLEHIAMDYRKGIEDMLGAQLPAESDGVTPDMEVKLSGLVAQAAQKLLGKNKAEAAQAAAQQQAQDPLVQIEMANAQTKAKEADTKARSAMANAAIAAAKLASDDENTKLKIAADLAKAGDSNLNRRAEKAADVLMDMAKTVHQDEQSAVQADAQHGRSMQMEETKAEQQARLLKEKNKGKSE